MAKKKDSYNLGQFKACVDQCVTDWNKTQLSDIEKWCYEEWFIWGVVHSALFILSTDEYQRLKNYIYTKYGYNVGGAYKE